MDSQNSVNKQKSCIICNLKFYLLVFISVFIVFGLLYLYLHYGIEKESNYNITEIYFNDNTSYSTFNWYDNDEIRILREYLQIPSVHPDVDYGPCVDFLQSQAENMDLPVEIYYPVDDKNPVVVLTWEGYEPGLSSIMLNSHMDVAAVYPEYWTHPPFAAEIDEDGNIFARGAQDMKSVGMQYLAAIRALKQEGVNQLRRTIYVTFAPDEEVGGARGIGGFVTSDLFHSMNVSFVLDEGSPSMNNDDVIPVYYGQRTKWQMEFIFHGHPGDGFILYENTPGEKLNYIVNKFTELRKEESRKLNDLNYPYGNVTTINLTKLNGGTVNNMIPSEMSATFDIRISVDTNIDDFEKMINGWCDEAGGNITIKTSNSKVEKEKETIVNDSNPFWVAFKNATVAAGIKVEPIILMASSDMKYVRRMNISALGFSPLLNTLPKAHEHDEYINAETYLNGIEIYTKIISSLGNV